MSAFSPSNQIPLQSRSANQVNNNSTTNNNSNNVFSVNSSTSTSNNSNTITTQSSSMMTKIKRWGNNNNNNNNNNNSSDDHPMTSSAATSRSASTTIVFNNDSRSISVASEVGQVFLQQQQQEVNIIHPEHPMYNNNNSINNTPTTITSGSNRNSISPTPQATVVQQNNSHNNTSSSGSTTTTSTSYNNSYNNSRACSTTSVNYGLPLGIQKTLAQVRQQQQQQSSSSSSSNSQRSSLAAPPTREGSVGEQQQQQQQYAKEGDIQKSKQQQQYDVADDEEKKQQQNHSTTTTTTKIIMMKKRIFTTWKQRAQLRRIFVPSVDINSGNFHLIHHKSISGALSLLRLKMFFCRWENRALRVQNIRFAMPHLVRIQKNANFSLVEKSFEQWKINAHNKKLNNKVVLLTKKTEAQIVADTFIHWHNVAKKVRKRRLALRSLSSILYVSKCVIMARYFFKLRNFPQEHQRKKETASELSKLNQQRHAALTIWRWKRRMRIPYINRIHLQKLKVQARAMLFRHYFELWIKWSCRKMTALMLEQKNFRLVLLGNKNNNGGGYFRTWRRHTHRNRVALPNLMLIRQRAEKRFVLTCMRKWSSFVERRVLALSLEQKTFILMLQRFFRSWFSKYEVEGITTAVSSQSRSSAGRSNSSSNNTNSNNNHENSTSSSSDSCQRSSSSASSSSSVALSASNNNNSNNKEVDDHHDDKTQQQEEKEKENVEKVKEETKEMMNNKLNSVVASQENVCDSADLSISSNLSILEALAAATSTSREASREQLE